jgi:Rieske Fe-S protein
VYEQQEPATDGTSTTRRVVLTATAASACLALAGCATYGQGNAPAATAAGTDNQAGAGSGHGSDAGAAAIARVSQLPVGGGLILADRRIVLTQPTAGTVRAFSAVCTHAGCTVSGISGGKITCPCHGSAFQLSDGSVANGPASQPLPSVNVTVDGDAIRLA